MLFRSAHIKRFSLECIKFVTKLHIRTIKQDIQDSQRSTSIVNKLVGEPYILRSRVKKFLRVVFVVFPVEAEDQAFWFEVIEGPWLDVVHFFDLDPLNAEFADENCEDSWIRSFD